MGFMYSRKESLVGSLCGFLAFVKVIEFLLAKTSHL